MGIFKFSLKMLKKEFSKSLFYCVSLTLSIAIIFVFFCYIDNSYLGNSISSGQNQFSQILALLVIIFAVFNCFFANNFFVSSKTNDLAIIQLSGASVFKVAGYLMVQNFVIVCISIPLGFVIGYFFNGFFNSLIYAQMNISGNIYYVSTEALVWAIVCIVTELLALTLMNTGFAYRTDIKDLLGHSSSMTMNAKRSKIPSIVYLALYIVPLVIFHSLDLEATSFAVYSVIGLFGINGLLTKGIPDLIKRFQKKNVTHSTRLIAFGNLSYSIKRCNLLINMLIISIILIVSFIIGNINDTNTLYLLMLTYYIVIFLLGTSILYKMVYEVSMRTKLYNSLYKLGYQRKQLKSVMKLEITLLYFVILLFPTSYIGYMLIRFVIGGIIEASFALTIVLSYVIPIALTGLIVYFSYKRTVFSHLQGGNS